MLNKLNKPARSFGKIYSIPSEKPMGEWGPSDAIPLPLLFEWVMVLGAIAAVLEAMNLYFFSPEDYSFLRFTLFF